MAVTIDAVKLGMNAAGQYYLGAIKGAFALADDLAYPMCPKRSSRPDYYD